MILRVIMFKPYILLVQCGRTILTLAGPSEYQCNCSCRPPRMFFLFLPLMFEFTLYLHAPYESFLRRYFWPLDETSTVWMCRRLIVRLHCHVVVGVDVVVALALALRRVVLVVRLDVRVVVRLPHDPGGAHAPHGTGLYADDHEKDEDHGPGHTQYDDP